MVSARGPRPAPYSTVSECSVPIRRSNKSARALGEDELRIIRVQDTRFKVNPRGLRAGSAMFKAMLKSPEPIFLSGHTAVQFGAFLWAVYAQPLPSAATVDLAQLCSVAEVSLKYDFASLKAWSIEGVKTHVSTTHILRTAPSRTFVRLMRLALVYRDAALRQAVQATWLTRLHWHTLPPAPALAVADKYGLQDLLCHASYAHLVSVAPCTGAGVDVDVDLDSPLLTPAQNLHVLCGYHSLRAAWKHLQRAPPPSRGPARWALEAGRPSAFAPVDVLWRLLAMERHLERDAVLRVCMDAGCREVALDAIARKRTEIAENLHHHFDL
ncbi:hypothetical protein B0H14DRAFT_3455052 [Mycena olivaceomarginata]|nr:hypothetical protein B0H14DRAFT_3455052 [Mycena olivaceomarginata]